MSKSRKLGRTGCVDNGGTYIPPDKPEFSGDCTGDGTSPRHQSPSRPLQPLPAVGADGPVDQAGGRTTPPSSVNIHGSAQLKGKRTGKTRKLSDAGAVPIKGRTAKGGPATGRTVPVPGPSTGHTQPEEVLLHGSVHPGPPSPVITTMPGDGLLYGRLIDRTAPAYVTGVGALSAARAIDSVEPNPWDSPRALTLRSEGHASTSDFIRCSGIPVSPQSSATTRSRSSKIEKEPPFSTFFDEF
ncbi:uncharacterized protein LOC119741668 [Patiria miniata]|uniref:Uncharacterized protein n=1 Tax=Patiria miniata TaxID=46514 RepID=A0A914BAR0_PATMI|nr:uncharacterized protein LOC119741552 [Patiria miniata]XP_038073438.1 uncharacterized protein LOC119741668 [Patiria miniata]